MDQVEGMRVFVRVAQRAGFAAAARELRRSPASVTKQVAALEARLGARLLERTTRRVALTEAGRVYLDRCVECLQAFDDADAAVSQLSAAPQGSLRISAPNDMQSQLTPVLVRYLRESPHVLVDLRFSNRPVDLVDEGFDLAIRAAPKLDGRFVARPIAPLPLSVVASPAYLREHGRPKRPADLANHRALVFVEPRPHETLIFERKGRQVRVPLRAATLCNSGDALTDLAVAGLGFVAGPRFLVDRALQTGKLEVVLPGWRLHPQATLWAVYPHRRFLPAKVKLFIDILRDTVRVAS
jgi:DNA-binding transcriptional LysR family regulator